MIKATSVFSPSLMNTEQKALSARILEQPFNLEGDLNDCTLRWTLDLQLFNGFCIKGVWNKDKKSATLSYVDMANIRTNVDESEFYYTSKWTTLRADNNQRKNNDKVKEAEDWKVYKPYDPKKREGEFIYYWKAPYPTQKVYPIPLYQGAMRAISIDISLDKYFHNLVTNGFMPTHIFNFYNGEPTTEKSQAIKKKIKDELTGTDGLTFIVNFAKSKDTAADAQTLTMTDADKQYIEVAKRSQQQIITGHLLTSGMLLGLYREGSLGGRSELQFSEEQFQNQYVSGQQNIIESVINELCSDFGLTARLYLKKVKRVAYQFPDTVIDAAFTPEEKRQYMIKQLGIDIIEQAHKNPAVELLKNISSISPLVANKVLESLSVGEIRDMVGLSAEPLKKITNTTTTTFSSQEDAELIEKFESIAKDYSNSILLYEREVTDFSEDGIKKSEEDFMAYHFAEVIKANTLERQIIDLLSKDNTTQPEVIAERTKASIEKVKSTIYDLVERKLLKVTSITGDIEGYEVTERGFKTLDEKPAKTAKIKVVYRYGLASSFKIVTVCNACGVEDGHSETCEFREKESLPN